MRDFKSMKRQRGRNRKPGGGGGGGGHGNNPNRAFDSNGPEGLKVRGNAQHVYERYQQLARDAASSGDRVLAENFLQHAEHYFRLMRAMQPNRPVSEIVSRDSFASGFDIDFEDESGVSQVDSLEPDAPAEGAETGDGDSQGGRPDRNNNEQREFRRDRDRDRDFRGENRDGNRDNRDRDRGEFRRDRDDRPRDDRQRDDRPRDDRPRDERPRDDRPREDRAEGEGRRESRRERFDRQRGERRPRYGEENGQAGGDPLAVVQPQAAPLAPRSEESSPVLRAEDGGESHMPAFLGRAAPTPASASSDEAAPAKKPRAPRRKKTDVPAGEDA